MTAPTPSPEEFAKEWYSHVVYGCERDAFESAIDRRDASLTAPLRAEVERLTRERDALHLDLGKVICETAAELGCANDTEVILSAIDAMKSRAERAEAEVTRLKPLLRECLGDYGHHNFTDRSGMADRIRKALAPEGGPGKEAPREP